MDKKWQVRKPDGNIYGPADISTIQIWIEENRILPEDDMIEENGNNWKPAKSISDFSDLFTIEKKQDNEVSSFQE